MHESEVTQSCPTLSDPMNCSPPGSSIHGIFQARVLEWGAIAFSFMANRRGKSGSLTNFLFFSSKITADGDCSDELKRRLLLRRKAVMDLDSVLKSRDITLLTKVLIDKAMIFPVVMYGCENWTIKAECQRTDAFKLWCWIRLLRVPWTARKANLSILKEINPEYSLEGLLLKLQYFI